MRWQFQSNVLFTASVVFLDDSDLPTICPDSYDISRLLLYRLEVIEAALLKLADLQGTAATTP